MKRIIFFSALFSTALYSCTDNDSLHTQNESLSVECYTRTSENKKDIVQDFGMYVYTSTLTDYSGVSNPVHVTYSGSWNFPQISLSGEIAQIYCFHPYTSMSNCKSLSLELLSQTDYLASSNVVTADKDNTSVNIVMKHILSKINVMIEGSNLCTVKLLSIPTVAQYDLVCDKMTLGDVSEFDTKSSSFYIFPSEKQQLKMNITYNGKEYEYTEVASNYESGKEYTFSLRINDDKELVIDGDVTITDWKEANHFEGSVNEK